MDKTAGTLGICHLDCFAGLTFVLTGVYDSLEREQMAEIIKSYGGKVGRESSSDVDPVLVKKK